MKYTKYLVPLFIILVVLYFVFEKKDPEKPQGIVNTLGEYFYVQNDKIDHIEITESESKIVLKKMGGAWFVESPFNSPADSKAVDELLNSVINNPLHRVIPADQAAELSEYGLDSPVRSITLYDGIKPMLDLKFGDRNITGSDFYARKGAGGEILLTAVQIDSKINSNPDHYRSRNPFQINENLVVGLSFNYPDNSSLVLQKDEKTDSWQITEPENFKALDSKINILLGQLRSLEIVKFLNTRLPDHENYNLDQPYVTFQLTYKSDNKLDTITLNLGETVPQENAVYARLSIMPEEDILVESHILHKLKLKIDQMREYRLFTINPAAIESVNVREKNAPNLTIMQTRAAEWRLISPVSGNVDIDKLDKFFDALLNITPLEFLSAENISSLGDDQTGFDNFLARIEIKLLKSNDRYHMIIGNNTDNAYYLTTSDMRGAGFLVNSSSVDKFLQINEILKIPK